MVWLTAKPREKYLVSLPGYRQCILNIIPEDLEKAYAGDEGQRKRIYWQYAKVLGLSEPLSWTWESYKIIPTGEPGNPPRVPRRHQARVIDTRVQGCTCEVDTCPSCDQGWHNSCRYDCQYGRPL